MCCRFLLLQEHYRAILAELGIAAPAEFLSRYNIAPGSDIPVVRTRPSASGPSHERNTKRELAALRWGLVPAWARSDEPAARLVNARAETLAAKPSFRDALRSRRCVIPASGFYEWENLGRTKKPWLFRRHDERPFGFAALWERWRTPDGTELESCAIITSEPNALMRPIHHRMPVMLEPAQFAAWLNPRTVEVSALADLLRPAPADSMSALAVSSHVSNVQHEGAECIAPAGTGPSDANPQLSLGLG